MDWLVLAIQIHPTAPHVSLAGACGQRGARPGCTPLTRSTPGLRTRDWTLEGLLSGWRRARGRWSYKLHSSCSCGGLEASRCGAGGGQGPADIEGARSQSYGPAAELQELRLRDCSEERDVRQSQQSKAVETIGSRVRQAKRCAVAGALTECAVGYNSKRSIIAFDRAFPI